MHLFETLQKGVLGIGRHRLVDILADLLGAATDRLLGIVACIFGTAVDLFLDVLGREVFVALGLLLGSLEAVLAVFFARTRLLGRLLGRLDDLDGAVRDVLGCVGKEVADDVDEVADDASQVFRRDQRAEQRLERLVRLLQLFARRRRDIGFRFIAKSASCKSIENAKGRTDVDVDVCAGVRASPDETLDLVVRVLLEPDAEQALEDLPERDDDVASLFREARVAADHAMTRDSGCGVGLEQVGLEQGLHHLLDLGRGRHLACTQTIGQCCQH